MEGLWKVRLLVPPCEKKLYILSVHSIDKRNSLAEMGGKRVIVCGWTNREVLYMSGGMPSSAAGCCRLELIRVLTAAGLLTRNSCCWWRLDGWIG